MLPRITLGFMAGAKVLFNEELVPDFDFVALLQLDFNPSLRYGLTNYLNIKPPGIFYCVIWFGLFFLPLTLGKSLKPSEPLKILSCIK